MIEVFKTNVQEDNDAVYIIEKLLQHFPGHKINFDLEDCDKILRVQGEDICIEEISALLSVNGFECLVLE